MKFKIGDKARIVAVTYQENAYLIGLEVVIESEPLVDSQGTWHQFSVKGELHRSGCQPSLIQEAHLEPIQKSPEAAKWEDIEADTGWSPSKELVSHDR